MIKFCLKLKINKNFNYNSVSRFSTSQIVIDVTLASDDGQHIQSHRKDY